MPNIAYPISHIFDRAAIVQMARFFERRGSSYRHTPTPTRRESRGDPFIKGREAALGREAAEGRS